MRYPINLASSWNIENSYPISSLTNTKMIVCKEDDDFLVVKTDKFGLRNNSKIWNEKNVDYAIVGDSFAFGECVGDEFTISGVINKEGKKAINLGVSGNGPTINYVSLKTFTQNTKPNKVIWLFFEGNDFLDLKTEMNSSIYNKILSENFNLNIIENLKITDNKFNSKFKIKNKVIKKCDEYLTRIKYSSKKAFFLNNTKKTIKNTVRKFLKFFENNNELNRMRPSFANKEMLADYINIVNKAKLFTNQKLESQFIFFYVPDPYRYKVNQNNTSLNIKDDILTELRSLNIKYIDMDKVIKLKNINPNEIYSLNGSGHFNKKGYEIATKLILEFEQN
jgi:hypothetical protein